MSMSVPIHSLEELKSWKIPTSHAKLEFREKCFAACESGGIFQDCLVKNVPKTLVCHDMKGGYLDDSLIDGCSNQEAYNFIQWSIIDIFVYFSHHFITIPPPCWIHGAHVHGVPILGTIITEWDEGAATCKQIFSSKDSVDDFVSSLTQLTLHHNFDGWLINIENPLEEVSIDNVIYFLRRLKQELVFAGNCGKIIWYDSVTKEGKLDWQNELNENNKDFFDACDGIFLNYVWKPENLKNSALMAGDRIFDVFVGIDVFGRNCFGGGGFNTNAALSVVRQERLSAAIFAPGWVYECHPVEEFENLSFKFWSLLFPYLNVHGPTSLPIRTSFCPGYGKSKYFGGQLVEDKPWHNISKQQLQPCLAAVRGLFDFETERLGIFKCGSEISIFGKQNLCLTDAFNGGGCLNIESPCAAIFPLFFCNIPVKKLVTIAIVFKGDYKEELSVNLKFTQFRTSHTTNVSCPLTSQMKQFPTTLNGDGCHCSFTISSVNIDCRCDELVGNLFRSMPNSSSWETRLFKISVSDQTEDCIFLRSIALESQDNVRKI
ncbi:cytosolic endo-beta-N-acetylglucosaminidase 1-like isoform X2 [Daphnia pulex]|uniref:cytosolic endo-beta-N-acetylglucosaminidase 1-like isoform X2 n=1 Tax=Daphnia pulex TaxID=6669 RepID=UPI001EE0499E|nr:cytosolic endo-beta-N-acetylglucosaminidase 1-like isoform X2 [Daphnia pulex]